MGNIVLLDDLTINQIAAGEVIERPASVIKEMLENSIDAGSKNVTIEIKNGGISLIRITDDGCGIAEDDMEISFERHATSKIRKAEDLDTVMSMGFRGEALASIASIAKVEMVSKKAEAETGHRLVIEGGNILEKSEIGCPVGTRITVENLFYNTPVRYKFLKKDYTEAGYIEDVVSRIALVNKDVAIKLISNGKTLIQTNGNGDSKSVIYSIYGKDVANGIIDIDYIYEDMKVTGVIGKPEIARANRSNQLFFINHRFVKDKNLSAAADQAYKGMIPIGKFGFLILNIDMDPKKVDVNVHPAKLEVRFQEEGLVFKAVYHAIKSGLGTAELVANPEKPVIVETKPQVEEKEETKIEAQEFEKQIAEEEEKYNKSGIGGLFKKILKEKDETESEKNNNSLKEIYEFREGLKKIGVSPVSAVPVDYENKASAINENIVNKEVKLGETSISSDTRELDFNVNEALKNAVTQVIETTKEIENDETQVVENVKPVSQETMVIDSIKLQENQETKVIDSTKMQENNSATQIIDTVKVQEEIKTENTVQENIPTFESITEKLLEQKLKANMQDTQMIDTSKIREALKEELPKEFEEMYKKTFGVDLVSVRREKQQEEKELNASKEFSYPNAENESVFEKEEFESKVNYKLIGIVFSTYIIIELANEMYIIDQHAAHERIMYEKVKANYYSEDIKDSQMLLLPDIITLTHKEMSIAKENEEMFEKAGFLFEEFGDNTIKLTAVPSMCEKLNTKQLFLDILDEVDTVAVTARQEKEDKFIATVACKSAVKAKMKLDEKEVDSLMQKLLKLPNPFTCPHGRPTAIKMTKYDLERKFSRR